MGVPGENPLNDGPGVDVESFFNAIDLLARRDSLEAAPFIGSRHEKLEEFDRKEPSRVNAKKLIRELFAETSPALLDAFKVKASTTTTRGAGGDIADAMQTALERIADGKNVRSRTKRVFGDAIVEVVEEIVSNWEKNLRSARPRSGHKLERELKKVVDAAQPESGEGDVFEQMKTEMLKQLVEIVWIQDHESVSYLKPLVEFAGETSSHVVTLNYDNSIELAADGAGVPVNRGFGGTTLVEEGFTRTVGRLQLVKLHESIDWHFPAENDRAAFPKHRIEIRYPAKGESELGYEPGVIFGGENKLTAQGPFLNLLRAYEEALQEADRVTVIGYSFRDPHVITFIGRWLIHSDDPELRVVDPGFEESTVPFVRRLKQFGGQNGQMEVLGRGGGAAIEELFGSKTG